MSPSRVFSSDTPRHRSSRHSRRPFFLNWCWLALVFMLFFLGGKPRSAAAVTMQITYTDGSNEGFYDPTLGAKRRAAFQSVISNWGNRLAGTVPIKISASFDPLGVDSDGSATLAQASPYTFQRDWSNFFNHLPPPARAATYYPIALANQQAGTDLDTSNPDIVVQCNSSWDTAGGGFYYGTDADPQGNQVDFYTVLLHEVGHGLGFTSAFNQDGSFGLENGYADIYDVFLQTRLNNTNQYITKITQAQRAAAFISNNVWFAAYNASLGTSDASCKIYAPNPYEEGSSISHLDESTFHGIDELMTPVSSEPVHAPGPRVTGIFTDIGWNISATDLTAPTVSVSSPGNGAVLGSLSDIHGNVSDSSSGIGRVHLKLQRASDSKYWSGTAWNTYTNLASAPEIRAPITSGVWKLSTNLPSGSNLIYDHYTVYVTGWDTANNQTDISSSFDIADISPPTVTLTLPVDNLGYKTLPSATGTASANTSYVKVALRRSSDGAWYAWASNAFGSTTFADADHARHIAVPPTSWTAPLPTLADGDYEFYASGVNSADVGSQYVSRVFHIDTTGPTLTVTSPASAATVTSFSAITGTASDRDGILNSKVTFTLYQNGQYWTGSAWSNTQTALTATVTSDGTWTYTTVPTGLNQHSGQYFVSASASDTLSNVSTPGTGNQTNFTVDASPPTCTITSPATGSIANGITSISGTAFDSNGLDRISLYIARQSDGAFWDGTAWAGGGSAILPVSYNASTHVWQSTGSLPGNSSSDTTHSWTNGSYDIIAIAYDKAYNETRADSIVTYQYLYTWTGATIHDSDPNTGNNSWDNTANWSPNGIPGPNDYALIDNGDTVQANGSHSVLSLTVTGNSVLNTTTLIPKNLNLNDGSILGGTVSSNSGVWNWTGGSISGTWNVLAEATWNMGGANTMALADLTTINNKGTINWVGSSDLNCYGGNIGPSTINNQSGAVFNFQADGTPFTTTYGSNFNNAAGAKITKTVGTGSTTLSGWTFNNSGELNSNSGTLAYNTTLNLNNGGTITGSSQHNQTGGNLNVTGTTTASATTFTLSGGTLNSTGTGANFTSTAGGVWNWTGGVIAGTLANAGTFNISGSGIKVFADLSVFNNTGTVNWSGGEINCYGGSSGPTTFNNKSGGTFNASAAANFTTTYGSIFNNQTGATFTRSGSGTTQSNWVFNNSGVVKCQSGTLSFNAGGTGSGSIQDASGTFVKFIGGVHTLTTPTFTGTGKYQISDSATVTLSGNMKLGDTSSPSTLEVLVGGTLNGTSTISGGNTTRSTLNWQGGTIGGTLGWASTLQTKISDPVSGTTTKSFADSTTINNDGVVVWSGVGDINCYAGNTGPTTFNNRSGGSFTCANSGTPFTTTYGSTFNNQSGAHFIKSGSGTVTLSGWTFNSAAETQVASGNTVEYTSTLNLNTGANFTGTGTTNFVGAINVNAPFSSTGPVQIIGTLTGTVNASYVGTALKWQKGSINGQLTIPFSSALAISGADDKALGDSTVLNNGGTITWSGGTINCYGGNTGPGTINNQSGAIFNLNGDGTPFSTTYGAIFNNLTGAHFAKIAGTGTTTISGWTFNNGTYNGTTLVTGGEVKDNTGSLVFSTTFNIYGGTFNGPGKHSWSSGTITVGAPFTIADTALTFSGGTLNGVTTGTKSGGVVTTGTGSFNWTGGGIIGAFSNAAASVFNISGTADKSLGDTSILNNSGTMTWTGGNITCYGGNSGPGTLNNASGGTFNARSTGSLTTTYGSKFNNSGTLNIGTSAVAGIFNCGWSYAQSSTGVLNLKVLGSNATTPQFDQLKIGGDASLAGTLNALLSSYVPPANALYKVITHGNRTGTFTKVLTTGSTARYFVAQYNANDVTLQAKQYELAVNDVKVTEGNSGSLNATFTVTLAGTQTLPVTLKYATADVTATAGKDYTATSGTLTFNPGDKTKTVSVPVLGDTIDEADETFNLNLSAPTNAAIVDATGVGTITDDDTSSISIDSPSIAEGNSSTVNLGFTVKLSTANSRTVTVKYATANGSAPIATAGTDYTATSGTLSFAPGETSKTLAVPIKGDLLNELDEKFNLVLFSPTNATISTGTGVGTIKNDDAVPALSAPDVSVTENAGSALFTVNLSAPSGQSITVKYATGISSSGFLATAGTDYTATSGTLTFTPGQTSKTFSVPIKNDTLDEENETYVITLSAPTNATISRLQATGTILDDDASPAVSVNSVAVTEGNSGVVNLNFTLKLSAASGRSVKVAYQTANGATNPATAGTDYVVLPLTSLSFNPGESSKSVTVQVKGDTLDEANETFKLVLSSPVNATLATGTQGSSVGIGTITDDDAAPSLSVDSPSVTEGNSGTVNLTFTLKLSAASGQVISVKYATANATTNPATAGIDYTALPLTSLTFNAGETSKTVVVQVKGDTLDELDEKLNLVLSSPTNATIATSTGVGTIKDDDATPTLSIDSPSILEGNSGTRVMNFTLKLSAASGQVVTVKYLTSNGTALAGSDYITNSGTLTFAAGETSKTVGVTIAGDATVEPNETFKLTLSAPTNATLATAFGTGTITNDDTATNAPSAGGA